MDMERREDIFWLFQFVEKEEKKFFDYWHGKERKHFNTVYTDL